MVAFHFHDSLFFNGLELNHFLNYILVLEPYSEFNVLVFVVVVVRMNRP